MKNGGQDYGEKYGAVDYGEAVVLDLGAGPGLMAKWFLLRGAKKVVASEKEKGAVGELGDFAAKDERLVVEKPLSHRNAAALLKRHRPDVVRCGCGGAEKSFLGVADELMRGPRAWVVETKVGDMGRLFAQWFRALGYEVEVEEEKVVAIRREVWAPARIEDFVAIMEKGSPFSYTNIGGDGEFLTIVGWPGTNSDLRTSTYEKGAALAEVILEPRCTFHGYNPGKNGSRKRLDAEKWLRRHGVNVPVLDHTNCVDAEYGEAKINVRWIHKEIISSANAKGRLAPFLRVLEDRPLLIVGTEGQEEFVERMGAWSVLLPPSVGWESMGDIEGMVRAKMGGMPEDTIVTWGLGYLAKVLEWRLAPDFPLATQIDVGANWDPYCGLPNRHAYKLPAWPDRMRENLSLLKGAGK